ncbi:hypothetical protein QR97_28205 [Streptomyces sp. PBH53]|nr:hypothetical protein QR97_28205 [Streptomyces sp. PBH53]
MAVRDGVRLVCRDWGGAGPAVVLLHGLAGHAGEWDVPARRLTDRSRWSRSISAGRAVGARGSTVT